jgi:subtilisin family serine protease
MTLLHQPDVARREMRRATSALQALLAVAVVICFGVIAAPAAFADPAATQAQEWWISRLDRTHPWTVSKGARVTVALLDSGVEAALGDLEGAVVQGFSASGGGTGEADTDTVEAHGTRMASEIAGLGSTPA